MKNRNAIIDLIIDSIESGEYDETSIAFDTCTLFSVIEGRESYFIRTTNEGDTSYVEMEELRGVLTQLTDADLELWTNENL